MLMNQRNLNILLRDAAVGLVLLTAVPLFGSTYGCVSTGPRLLSPQARGYYDRALEMLDYGNYAGVIDQLGTIETNGSRLPEEEKQDCA